MSARKKKTTRKKKSTRSRNTIDSGLRDLEKRLPSNLRGPVRDLRANLKSLQKQMEKARADREERWKRIETQIRREAANALRRLEKAVAGSARKVAPKKKGSAKKTRAKKKTGRKKTTRKPARRATTRKKASRKKTARR